MDSVRSIPSQQSITPKQKMKRLKRQANRINAGITAVGGATLIGGTIAANEIGKSIRRTDTAKNLGKKIRPEGKFVDKSIKQLEKQTKTATDFIKKVTAPVVKYAKENPRTKKVLIGLSGFLAISHAHRAGQLKTAIKMPGMMEEIVNSQVNIVELKETETATQTENNTTT